MFSGFKRYGRVCRSERVKSSYIVGGIAIATKTHHIWVHRRRLEVPLPSGKKCMKLKIFSFISHDLITFTFLIKTCCQLPKHLKFIIVFVSIKVENFCGLLESIPFKDFTKLTQVFSYCFSIMLIGKFFVIVSIKSSELLFLEVFFYLIESLDSVRSGWLYYFMCQSNVTSRCAMSVSTKCPTIP